MNDDEIVFTAPRVARIGIANELSIGAGFSIQAPVLMYKENEWRQCFSFSISVCNLWANITIPLWRYHANP